MITPKGEAYAHVLIDYGPEFHLFWVCFQDDTGECWTWANPDVRGVKNVTLGRKHISPFGEPAVAAKPLRQIFPTAPVDPA
jgi:hypothetical protein